MKASIHGPASQATPLPQGVVDWQPGHRSACQGASRLRHLATECQTRHVDAIARLDLIIGRRVAQLDDLLVAHWQHDATAFAVESVG